MKHLSMSLTVLLLGVLPLAAVAAVDYGPNRPLLAATGNASQLPSPQAAGPSAGAAPKLDLLSANNDSAPDPAPSTPLVPPPTSSTPPSAAPRGGAPSASNKTRGVAPAKPETEPAPESWRSLLPGSIQ